MLYRVGCFATVEARVDADRTLRHGVDAAKHEDTFAHAVSDADGVASAGGPLFQPGPLACNKGFSVVGRRRSAVPRIEECHFRIKRGKLRICTDREFRRARRLATIEARFGMSREAGKNEPHGGEKSGDRQSH
ncbi:hypothetical protein LXM94_17675 [Rhizobium sp. TRM95111]|nr:hypothetical protein [Rhizobium alarense]MCF3641805.1 hypothetical protein [Rhizobium alarense]